MLSNHFIPYLSTKCPLLLSDFWLMTFLFHREDRSSRNNSSQVHTITFTLLLAPVPRCPVGHAGHARPLPPACLPCTQSEMRPQAHVQSLPEPCPPCTASLDGQDSHPAQGAAADLPLPHGNCCSFPSSRRFRCFLHKKNLHLLHLLYFAFLFSKGLQLSHSRFPIFPLLFQPYYNQLFAPLFRRNCSCERPPMATPNFGG